MTKPGRYIGMYNIASADTRSSGQYLKWDGSKPVWDTVDVGDSLSFSGSTSSGVLTYGGASQIDVESVALASGVFANVVGVHNLGGDLSIVSGGVLSIFGSPNVNITSGRLDVSGTSASAGYINLYEDTDNGTNKVSFVGPASCSDQTITLPDASGEVALKDGKQYQVFPCNFVDDLNTDQVFLPIHGTTFEQSTVYQDDVAIIAPCDGRVVSLALSCMSLSGSGDFTVKVYTRGPNNSGTNLANWTEEESEVLAFTGTDDSHVFHFAFSNAKHFESTEKFVVSIQASVDPGANTYWYGTVVVEWDYSTLLGTSAEFDAAP
jgi:hypothetical protein